MINRYTKCLAIVCAMLGALSQAVYGEQDGAPVGDAPLIDESAVTLLKEMTATLAGLNEFEVTMETGFEVLQPNGQKFEFGARRSANIRRPNQARFAFQRRTGERGEIILDGSNIWAYDKDNNVYASISQPDNLDASLDFVTEQLGIPVPIDDFLAEDPSITLAQGVLEARDLGPSIINNQAGRQIALRKDGVDYQVWVNGANHLPSRLVITYDGEPGQPQFWVQFLKWETAPNSDDSAFEFSPPEGTERIRFATFDSSVVAEEEAK